MYMTEPQVKDLLLKAMNEYDKQAMKKDRRLIPMDAYTFIREAYEDAFREINAQQLNKELTDA
jgi:hypothetical protein